jgi:uncharacterized membrane protein YeaQ/YmgE (transglycosylase-associated protein family)
MDFVNNYIVQLPESARSGVEYVVVWIGFSTIVGLLAKGIMFGKARTATSVTIILGWLGTIIGWSIASIYTDVLSNIKGDWKQKLLTPATFLIAVFGALILLFFHKLLSGRFGVEKEKD